MTSVPAQTPLSVRGGCGPPLPERYCATVYRLPPPACPTSEVWDVRDDLGPAIGEPPVWMVAYPVAGPFKPGPLPPSKTIWVVADEQAGEVKLTGRRLDGPGVALFPSYERDPDFGAGTYQKRSARTELVLIPPHGIGQDHRIEVSIPSAGCWQWTVRVGGEQVTIVQYLYEMHDVPAPPATPVDFTKGCGPPQSSRYCELWYRQPPPSCPVSGVEIIRSDGLRGIGTEPFWLVVQPVYQFTPEEPKKRIWILADGVTGQVKLTGRQLDGTRAATFPRYQRDDSFSEQVQGRTELVLLPPHGRAEDHRTTVFYESAGCWEFTAQIGTESVTVVHYLYEE